MNCLLLLIILFSCGNQGNNMGGCIGSCGRSNRNCGRNNGDRGRNNGGCSSCNAVNPPRCNDCERQPARRDCDCEGSGNHQVCTPPPMPRTQFPYLEVEPRTCGCEEK